MDDHNPVNHFSEGDSRSKDNSYPSQNQDYPKFGKQVGYTVAANIVTLLITLVQIPILTRGLGADFYGIWVLVNTTVFLVSPLACLSLGTAIVRFLASEKDENKVREDFFSTFLATLISGIVFSALITLLSGPLSNYVFKDARVSQYVSLASILILLNALYTLAISFMRMRRTIGLYTLFGISKAVLQVGAIFAVLQLGLKLDAVIIVSIATLLIIDVVALGIIFKQIGFTMPSLDRLRVYLKWGIPLIPNDLILWIINTSDRYMVSYFLGAASTGIYNAAYNIGQYASFALTPLGVVLYPNVVKTYHEGRQDETRRYLKYSTKYLLMVAIPSAFALSVLAKPLLILLTSDEFISASSVVPFVAFGVILYCFYLIGFYIINTVNKTPIIIRILAAAAGLNIILNLILIPRMNLIGAALATLLSYGLMGVLTLILTRRYLKFDLNPVFIAKSVFASLVMLAFLLIAKPQSALMVLVSIILGILIYFGILIIVRGLDREELVFFFNIAKNILKRGNNDSTVEG